MHLEEAIQRLQIIVTEMEDKQLPLHEVIKRHEEGNKLVAFAEDLLKQAQNRIKVTEVGVDSVQKPVESSPSKKGEFDAEEGEISLY